MLLAQLDRGHDLVDHAVLEHELGGLEALGQLLPDGLLDQRGPAKPIIAPGSARMTSASTANDAVTPP